MSSTKEMLLEQIVMIENQIHRLNEDNQDASTLREQLQRLVSEFNTMTELTKNKKSVING